MVGSGGLTRKPKRAQNAYMIWLNQNRQNIRRDFPNLKVPELGKKAGELWRQIENKAPWEAAAQRDKLRHAEEMHRWEQDGGAKRSLEEAGSGYGKRMKLGYGEKKKKKLPGADKKKKKKVIPAALKKRKPSAGRR